MIFIEKKLKILETENVLNQLKTELFAQNLKLDFILRILFIKTILYLVILLIICIIIFIIKSILAYYIFGVCVIVVHRVYHDDDQLL